MGRVVKQRQLKRPGFVDLVPPGAGRSSVQPEQEYDLVELKMDGIWGQLIVDDEKLTIWSQHGQLKFGPVPMRMPPVVVHGEYLYGSNWANRRGMGGQFWAFDIASRRGISQRVKPLTRRKSILSAWLADAKPRLGAALDVFEVESRPAVEWRRLWDEKVLGDDYEGLVFKAFDGLFGGQWARMKRRHTDDFVCIGVNPGGGRYAGNGASSIQAGLYVDGELKHVANVGGLNDDLRRELWAHPERFVGRVFEAEGRGRFDGGALRHPNFVRWHDDKLPEQCVWRGR